MSSGVHLGRARGTWFWYLVAMTCLTALYVLVPPFKGNAALINLIGLTSPIAIAVGIRMHRPKATLAWLLLLFGQSLYVAGDWVGSEGQLADASVGSAAEAARLLLADGVRAAPHGGSRISPPGTSALSPRVFAPASPSVTRSMRCSGRI